MVSASPALPAWRFQPSLEDDFPAALGGSKVAAKKGARSVPTLVQQKLKSGCRVSRDVESSDTCLADRIDQVCRRSGNPQLQCFTTCSACVCVCPSLH